MATDRLISRLQEDFGHSPVVANMLFAFVLAIVEKIVEVEFACPCNPQWNGLFASAFFVIPACISFFLMLIIHECKCKNHSIKCVYSILPPLVWQVLVFLDGQYFVCAMTDWPGTFVSVDNTYLKWCTPSNTTRYSPEELMARSHKHYALSQGIGFGILIFFAIALLVYGIKKCNK